MDYASRSLEMHRKWRGKIEIAPRAYAQNADELSLAYTPGVAQPCLEIQKDISLSYELTRRHNLCLVVTDGSAVLGLGDIGPEAAMPVMEGKCLLFKQFADVDAFPLCIKSKDVDEIVRTVSLISGSFAGVNLEDISAPRCFEIERRLKETCDIPIFHDDQHGTAIVVLAALINALRVTGRELETSKIIINGAGAAGAAIGRLLLDAGAKSLIFCDKSGALCAGDLSLPAHHAALAGISNPAREKGNLTQVLHGADVFIGVSAPEIVNADMVKCMAPRAILFPMANPVPEIMPDLARSAGAAVIGTGRSDFPNQINNVLAFPGVFRGAFDVRASDINESMKLAAARALADVAQKNGISADYIIPSAFDKNAAGAVAKAVAEAARASGVARI